MNSKDAGEELDLEHDSPKNNSVPKHDVVLWRRATHTGGRIFLKSGEDRDKMVREYRGRRGGETEAQKETENRREPKKLKWTEKGELYTEVGGQKEISLHVPIKDDIKWEKADGKVGREGSESFN